VILEEGAVSAAELLPSRDVRYEHAGPGHVLEAGTQFFQGPSDDLKAVSGLRLRIPPAREQTRPRRPGPSPR
jgi:hypothetical protein